ncbi:cobalt transporter CbiM [Geopsychrobacter electrodiphilus]|uniref:cobalt transporter CbiM n=1 Tax=Geopsychrobacter electrodiphilus TaxID=225196 RepID=UPI000370E8C2|nr:cobalt transporter CbiM [Geopsychrobacter electrodiphilus]
MHISDGVLPISVAIGTYVVSAGICTWSVKRTRSEDLPKVAVLTAAFFVASLIHLPFGPTSVHLIIPGLVGALLGPSAFLAIALGLVLQCLLFQFGGLTALGANMLMMGLPALLAGWFFYHFKGRSRKQRIFVGALCGGGATVFAALLLALLLASGGEDFYGVAKLALIAHIPVVLIETGVTAMIVSFLLKVKPELLETPFALKGQK